MTMQQAILGVPKLRNKLQSAVRTAKTQTDFKKQASGYCHTYYSSQNIDYALLSDYPSDVQLSAAYEGLHRKTIVFVAPPPAPDPAFEHLYLQEDGDGESEIPEKSAAEELQQLIDNIQTTIVSKAVDQQLEACVMASVALSMDELAKIEDLPETNPQRFAEMQKDIALAMATQPVAFIVLLQGMADSALKNTSTSASPVESPPVSHLLIDVSSADLSPFVTLRREHQTEESRKGVRTYKSSGTYTNPKTGVVKPLSDRQILACQMQAIIRQDQERGSSTGLNRTFRWTGEANNTHGDIDANTAAKPATGNTVNAQLAAGGRSKEAIKRHQLIFAKIKCTSTVVEAGIGSSSERILEDGCYGFAMVGSEIALVRVMTMYTKNGGKAGAHAWTPTSESVGALSFVVAQVYELEFRRRFRIIPNTLRIWDESVKTSYSHVEIGTRAQIIFVELAVEKEVLAKAVAGLNTVRRKGKANIHIMELPEDDYIED
ncbi:hypothetical protein B0H10DRAFT_2221177 [Mycena sp. CBHHK59/15]|nr:hypothetical protein B0H10DRAFT_2221177 [Mycena sp. CBHHK59/15]